MENGSYPKDIRKKISLATKLKKKAKSHDE